MGVLRDRLASKQGMAGYRATAASRGQVLIPRDLHRVRGGLWTYASCRRYVLAANQITGWLAGRSVKLVPGVHRDWDPPFSPDDWSDWQRRIGASLGAVVEDAVVHLPADKRRRRFSLLLLDRTEAPIGHVKFAMAEIKPATLKALAIFAQHPTSLMWVPSLVESGSIGEWRFLLTTTMPQQAHRHAVLTPVRRRSIIAEIQERLAEVVGLPANGTAAVHGDFGPWNVRELRDGTIAVVDWEDVGVGPIAADELWHAVNIRIVSGDDPDRAAGKTSIELGMHKPEDVEAAARFWLARLAAPQPEDVEPGSVYPRWVSSLRSRLQRALEVLVAA